MTTNDKLTSEGIQKAQAWYRDHQPHVERVIKEGESAYPPSGSDRINPQLWKSGHWRWFKEEGYLHG